MSPYRTDPPCHWCRCDQVFRMHCLLGLWVSKNSNNTVSDDVVLQAHKETWPHLTYRLLEDKDTARCFKPRRCSWIILVILLCRLTDCLKLRLTLRAEGAAVQGPMLGMCTGETCSALGCPLPWAADLELEGAKTRGKHRLSTLPSVPISFTGNIYFISFFPR